MNYENASCSTPCEDVLDSFLHDMSELDHQPRNSDSKAEIPVLRASSNKRELLTTSTTATSTTKKQRSNPSWLKRKRELQTLREESQALETRVEFLKAKQAATQNAPTIVTSETLQQQQELKQALQVEKELCRDTQEENETLRRQVQSYANFSGALQSVLLSAQHQRALLTMSMAAAGKLQSECGRGMHQLRLASPSVFDMLEERVNVRFRELEASFGETQDMTTPDTELVQIGDQQVGTARFKRAQLFPFEESTVFFTMWSIVELGGFPDGQVSRVTRRSDDAVAVDAQLTVCLENGGSVHLTLHSLLKKFQTPHGLVVVIESNSDWSADVQDPGAWIHKTEEKGYFVIRSYGASNVSQVRSELTLRPDVTSERVNSCPVAETHAINDVVIPSFREVILSRHQMMENVLFDQIRGDRVVRIRT